jgi:hypothetical protein
MRLFVVFVDIIRLRNFVVGAIAFSSVIFAGSFRAEAEAVKVTGTLAVKEQIRLDFKDGTGHLFAMLSREGPLDGTGAFAKTKAQDYGVHDVYPGAGGSQTGYLVIAKSDADIAYLKWSTQSTFIKGADGKAVIVNNGTWTYMSGLGSFKGLKGNGSIKITFGKDTERTYSIEGNLNK